MSQKVSVKDTEFALYAGGHPETTTEMARIDVMLDTGLIPSPLIPFVKLRRALLDRQRKAWLASTGSEITMLGFLLGKKSESISAI